jgi:hypothetical protein
MKKVLLLIIFMVLALTGCTNNSRANTPAANTGAENGKAGEVRAQEKKGKELYFSRSSGMTASCSTEEGYYYISSTAHGDDHGNLINLMYLDYKSSKEMFLCNQPGCTHDTDSCNSLLADVHIGDTEVIFISRNRLYMLVTPQDDSGSMSTGWSDPSVGAFLSTSSGTQPKLYSMYLDGTDRRVVSEFGSGIVVEGTAAACDDSIYVICKKIKSEEIDDKSTYKSAYDRQLVCIDAANGKQKTVCDLEEGSRLIGSFGSKLVFQATRFARELSPKEIFDDAIYKQELKKAKIIVSVLDVDTCKDSKMFEITGDKTFTSQVSGSKFYYSIEGENQVKSLDLSSGTDEVIANTPNSNIDWVYDESIRIRSWDYDDNKYYSLNLSSKEIRETGLYTGQLHNPVTILAENKEYFLVIYDYKCSGEYTTWAGTKQNDIVCNKLGLISKEDYLKGNPSYKPIEVIGDGR